MKLTTQGLVTIPASIRKNLGLRRLALVNSRYNLLTKKTDLPGCFDASVSTMLTDLHQPT